MHSNTHSWKHLLQRKCADPIEQSHTAVVKSAGMVKNVHRTTISPFYWSRAFTRHQLLLKISARRGNNGMETTPRAIPPRSMLKCQRRGELVDASACYFNFPGATINMRRGVFHKLQRSVHPWMQNALIYRGRLCYWWMLRMWSVRCDPPSLPRTHGTCACIGIL